MLYKCLYLKKDKTTSTMIEAAVNVDSIQAIVYADAHYTELIVTQKETTSAFFVLGTVDKVIEEVNELKRLSRENW